MCRAFKRRRPASIVRPTGSDLTDAQAGRLSPHRLLRMDNDRDVRALAGWFPAGQEQLESWLKGHTQRVNVRPPQKLRPSVAAFKRLIDTDPIVGMLVHRMIRAGPAFPRVQRPACARR